MEKFQNENHCWPNSPVAVSFFFHSLLSPNHQYDFLSRLFPLLYYQLLHLWLSNSLGSCRLNPGKRAKNPMLWFLGFFLSLFSSLPCFKNAAFNFRERCSLIKSPSDTTDQSFSGMQSFDITFFGLSWINPTLAIRWEGERRAGGSLSGLMVIGLSVLKTIIYASAEQCLQWYAAIDTVVCSLTVSWTGRATWRQLFQWSFIP